MRRGEYSAGLQKGRKKETVEALAYQTWAATPGRMKADAVPVCKGNPRASLLHRPWGQGWLAIHTSHSESSSWPMGLWPWIAQGCIFTKWIRAYMEICELTLEAEPCWCHLHRKSHTTHLFKGLIALIKNLDLLFEMDGKYCIVFILLKQLFSKCKRALDLKILALFYSCICISILIKSGRPQGSTALHHSVSQLFLSPPLESGSSHCPACHTEPNGKRGSTLWLRHRTETWGCPLQA